MKTLVAIISLEDKSNTNSLQSAMKGRAVVKFTVYQKGTIVQAISKLKQMGLTDGIVISNVEALIDLLTYINIPVEDPTLNQWAGSYLMVDNIPVIIINPLRHFNVVPHYKFVTGRYLDKLLSPEKFPEIPDISWEIAKVEQQKSIAELFSKAKLISFDTETFSMGINMCGVTGLFLHNNGKYFSHTVVIPWEEYSFVVLTKTILENDVPKIAQNGMYDLTYLLRFGIAVKNYLYDTMALMHSWMVELPKDLAFLTSIFIRNFRYWKFEANSKNLSDQFFYNAKDCHTTLWVFLAIINEIPDWALYNYTLKFKESFPSVHCGLRGFKDDAVKRQELIDNEESKKEECLRWLQNVIHPEFNPNSPVQVKELMRVLGFKVDSTDDATLTGVADADPFSALIIEKIQDYRGSTKLISSYFNYPVLDGRVLFHLNPFGTDSGRFSSSPHHFSITEINTKGGFKYIHYGVAIQTVPRNAKSMLIADDGYLLGEIDYSQSESRTTGYITREEKLIEVVETSPDFHCANASLFFGIPFEELYDAERHKKLNVPIRDLSKRTNHGANYGMGAWKMLYTMGAKNVRKAQQLLKLPKGWRPVKVTEFLLNSFDKAYPKIHGEYQNNLVEEVKTTGMMKIPCEEFSWTRLTFKDINIKHNVNSALSFKPQCLSGLKCNDSFYKIWKEFDLKQKRIRVVTPVHDSIVFQHKIGDEKVVEDLKLIMETPMTIHGVVMRIPVDYGVQAKTWAQTKD